MLLAAGVMWTGWYAYDHGFSRKWRNLVRKEFAKRGIDLSVRRITLDPLRGIVAHDLRVKDAIRSGKTVAVVDQAVLDINYGNLIHRRPFLNAVDLRSADLWVPLDPADPRSERIEISKLSARLLLSHDQWYLSEAAATVAGVRISARGRLLNPELLRSPRPEPQKKDDGKWRGTVLSVLEKLRELDFRGGPPQIDVEFSGDVAAPESIYADATLRAAKVRRGKYQVEHASATVAYRNGMITIKRCALTDARGALEASGSFDAGMKTAAAVVRSTLDLQALARALKTARFLEDLVFYVPPLVELSGEWNGAGTQPAIKVLGHAELGKFGLKSSIFEGASADFAWDGTRWYLRNGSIRDRTGAVTVSALQTPGAFRAKVTSDINPRALGPLLSGKAAEVMREWEFLQSPHVNLTVSGPAPDPARCEVNGELRLGRTRIRGVPLNSATATVRLKDGAVSYENFRVERDEGAATGSFSYDFGRHEVRLNHIKGRLHAAQIITWIDPKIVPILTPYRFRIAPNVTVHGVVGTKQGKGTNLNVFIDAPSGMEYDFLKRTLAFPKISGRLHFLGRKLRLIDLAATLYGGGVRGGAEISLAKEAPGYTARVEADGVDFASITKLYFDYESSHGELNGWFDFHGRDSNARTLAGNGEVTIVNGNVFAIPVLGPFSAILNNIVPGMGYNVARKARCSFTIRDGVIATPDFLVEGTGFSMIGNGRLFFLDDRMDFDIRLNAQGVPGVLLFPVSKLFEYTSEGSLSKPAWRLKRLPSL